MATKRRLPAHLGYTGPKPSQPSIAVIEPAGKPDRSKDARRLPFGFARVLAPPPPGRDWTVEL